MAENRKACYFTVIGNAFVFAKVPIAPLIEDGESGPELKELFRLKIFWILLVMMVCPGASEQAVSQWASAFAEKRLGISLLPLPQLSLIGCPIKPASFYLRF